ncbi:MAG: LysR family transcriptional regulator [Lachnospiraceae bacterium]|nr:LysR family transcriptional regulator [Lachnospiraceae bacterium]
MNTTQIKCFMAVAETLNFTKAAEQLFISQPGLSRQIVSLERELNTLLFIRDKHQVKLTPAAAVLYKELEGFHTRYEEVLHKVRRVGQGYSGSLTLGTLGGQYMREELADKLFRFMNDNPQIDINIKQGSFKDLRNWLETGDIDIAISLNFDVAGMKDVINVDYIQEPPVFAVSKRTKLGQKKKITVEDLKDATIILISPDDSPAGCEFTSAFLRANGLDLTSVRYAPNLATAIVWIEAGQGVGVINQSSNIFNKSSVRILDEIRLAEKGGCSICFTWKSENYNPAIPMWVNEE